jgi:hypothetical protein
LGGLAPGTYDVTTQAPGFEQQTLQAVVIPSRPNEADVSLKVGEASETVEVETNADALDKSHPAPPKALAKSSARSSAPPVFEITTDNGDRWTSPDGLVWMRK